MFYIYFRDFWGVEDIISTVLIFVSSTFFKNIGDQEKKNAAMEKT